MMVHENNYPLHKSVWGNLLSLLGPNGGGFLSEVSGRALSLFKF